MLTFILALAVVLALGAVGYLSTKQRGFKEVEPSTTGGRWLYRGLACLSMAVSAALLYALYRAYRVPVEPGDFYIATDWKGFGVFVFILWLCLSGLVCFIATNAAT